MKVKQNSTVSRMDAPSGRKSHAANPSQDKPTSPLIASVVARLGDGAPRFVACAPGRLDVVGGFADYTGALVLNTSMADHVCVAVQARQDGNISISSLSPGQRDGMTPTVLAVSALKEAAGNSVESAGKKLLDEQAGDDTVRCVVGALVEALRDSIVADWSGGLSIVVASTLRDYSEAGHNAAVAAATLVASARVGGADLETLQAATLCHRVEMNWLAMAVGIGDAVSTVASESNCITQARCDPCTLAGSIRLPDDLVLLGIDCEAPHAESRLKYTRVRTAAFMGRVLIDRIIKHEGYDRMQWEGYLARISMTDYVERFRDRIPTKMLGQDFLDRFGETGDPRTRIETDFIYKIRSRTEHHIYENARANQFSECFSRGIRTGDDGIIAEAGELMYASHWSYGQRCGLSGVRTDRLVNLIRRHGKDAGIYGAKLAGRGLGGVVTVFMRDTEPASGALGNAIEDYQVKTGHTPKVIRGSMSGALRTGAIQA